MEDLSYWFGNMWVFDYFSRGAIETLKCVGYVSAGVIGVALMTIGLYKGASIIGKDLDSDRVRSSSKDRNGLVRRMEGRD